jgi:hypothetical protein
MNATIHVELDTGETVVCTVIERLSERGHRTAWVRRIDSGREMKAIATPRGWIQWTPKEVRP